MEKEDMQSYRHPCLMGKAMGKEEPGSDIAKKQ